MKAKVDLLVRVRDALGPEGRQPSYRTALLWIRMLHTRCEQAEAAVDRHWRALVAETEAHVGERDRLRARVLELETEIAARPPLQLGSVPACCAEYLMGDRLTPCGGEIVEGRCVRCRTLA